MGLAMKNCWIVLGCLWVARLAAAAESPLVVDNGGLRLTIDPAQHGAITSLTIEGQEFIRPTANSRLFQLEFTPPGDLTGKRTIVTSRDMAGCKVSHTTSGQTTTARVEFQGPAAQPITVVCTLSATQGDPLVRMRIAAQFPPTLALEAVRFPLLSLKAPLGDGASDALVFGSTKGGVYQRLATYKVGQSVSFGQPGNLAAALTCYGDDAAGLLTAMFDARGYRKNVGLTRTPEGVELSWMHACLAEKSFALDYDAVLAGYGRKQAGRAVDWHDGADLYKAWAVKQPWCAKRLADRDDLPAWLRQGPAMVRFNRDALAKPPQIETWLRDYWKANFPDMPLVVAYWGWEKVNTWITPDYFPCYPSDDEFRRLVAVGRSLGAHAFLWPSGYHYTLSFDKRPDGSFTWDDRARFDTDARSHAVCGRDGKVIFRDASWLRGGTCATMCPGDPWTIDWFNKLCQQMTSRGVEIIQVDQVVGGNFPICFSAAHGHKPGPGLWMSAAFDRQLTTLLATCRRHQPDAVIGVEEPNEWFIHRVGIQDYRDLESLKGPATLPASVFGYLYHEYLPVFQSNPIRGNRVATTYCLVNGQIPQFVPLLRVGSGALLLNGGFEDVALEKPEKWDYVRGHKGAVYSGEATLDAQEHHSGQRALRLRNTEAQQVVQVAQNVSIGGDFAVGRKYRLSAWVKTAGIKPGSGLPFGTFATGLKSTGSWRIPLPPPGDAWTHQSAEFTVPPQSEMLRIMLQINGPGTCWIDDLRLEEIRGDGTTVEVQQPRWPLDHELMRQWVTLFHGAGRPYLHLGQMIHPPRLECASIEALGRTLPAVLHNAFQAADGSRAVVMVNAGDEPQNIKLAWPKPSDQQQLRLGPWEVKLLRAGN